MDILTFFPQLIYWALLQEFPQHRENQQKSRKNLKENLKFRNLTTFHENLTQNYVSVVTVNHNSLFEIVLKLHVNA